MKVSIEKIKVSTIPSNVGKNVFAFKYLTFFHNPNINNKVPNISPSNLCHQIIQGWNILSSVIVGTRECRLIALTAFIDPSMQPRPKDWGFHLLPDAIHHYYYIGQDRRIQKKKFKTSAGIATQPIPFCRYLHPCTM